MDAQQFLTEFGHIANAPGGVSKLRELVLQLAISARLTERVADDTSALELIEANKKRQKSLVAQKVLKRQPAPRPVASSDQPWALPEGWAWTRLGSVTNYGDAPKVEFEDVNEDTWVLELEDIEKGTSRLLSKVFARERKFKSTKNGFPAGAVLYGKLRPYLDKVLIADSPGVCTTEINPISFFDNIDAKYLRWYLKSPYFIAYADGSTYGMNLPRLGTDSAREALFAFPPFIEQSRIVAKVDELMALCDTLEAQQQARRKLQNNLRQSSLQAVASAASPYELQTTWARLADNFGRLFHAPGDVVDLRKAVLDLAVSGYLSHPEELDEPAAVLKSKILAAKERGIADGSFSRKKHVKPEELEETTLPLHWESITLDDAISTIDAGWSPACLPNARDDESKWGVLKTTSVQVLRFLPHEHKELPASLDPRPQYQIELGDILITRAGPKNRVGICCVVDSAPPKLMISDKLIRFHIVGDLINPRFVALCLSAGEPGRIVERLKSGMADSQMNISQDKLRSITIPLPPIQEQQRILEKIEAFMVVVDAYSERLSKSLRLAEQVAAVAVSAITGVAIEQEEEPMKAPQTELVAPLRLGTAPGIKDQAMLATILARHSGEMSAKDLWQRFGGEIDAFYAQLKIEVAHGWILEPAVAEMREKPADAVRA
ncbi:restriction endonuclease subunit S [Massilia norwichensis]|uniref:Restriction endonuclease subunit S n=1 Tax=Massilia norwichensis TaxID=1442366 RepID=A0ABT2A8C4_9BURK|nr:restriction endonuclease subunit S [Massilia norwichensis]MCS0590417.1 restriction endonuclease subunit S [Massilia norwichensis]